MADRPRMEVRRETRAESVTHFDSATRRIKTIHILKVAKTIPLVLMCCSALSCKQGPPSMTISQSAKIESALRDLLVTQRASIEKDAPFVYEIDTFAGGVTVFERGNFVIGKWTVEVAKSRAHATIQRRFGEGQRFESEVIEVDLEIFSGDSVKVSHWRAYRGWGKQTSGAVGSPGATGDSVQDSVPLALPVLFSGNEVGMADRPRVDVRRETRAEPVTHGGKPSSPARPTLAQPVAHFDSATRRALVAHIGRQNGVEPTCLA